LEICTTAGARHRQLLHGQRILAVRSTHHHFTCCTPHPLVKAKCSDLFLLLTSPKNQNRYVTVPYFWHTYRIYCCPRRRKNQNTYVTVMDCHRYRIVRTHRAGLQPVVRARRSSFRGSDVLCRLRPSAHCLYRTLEYRYSNYAVLRSHVGSCRNWIFVPQPVCDTGNFCKASEFSLFAPHTSNLLAVVRMFLSGLGMAVL